MEEKENIKFQTIVDTSKSLFWKFGINRVTIEEICREADVSKMTFYKYFANKNELVKYILKKLFDDSWDQYNFIMSQDIPYPEKIKQTIELKMKQTDHMSNEFFKDFHKNVDPVLKSFFIELTNDSLEKVKSDYIKAQKEGNIRSDINPDFILYFLNHMLSMMAQDDSLISLYSKPGDLIYELINFFFFGIMQRNNNEKK